MSGKPFTIGHDARRTTNGVLLGGLARAKQREEKYQATLFEDLSVGQKRRRVFEEQNFTCLECKNDMWLGKPIKLEYDHIDGNNKNDERINVRGLCPNCHSFTETWRKKKSCPRGLVGNRHTLPP